MINLLYNTVFSGARSNKYRIHIPITPAYYGTNDFSQDVNTLCQTTSMPGKSITPTEVVIKGRKVQLRGETALEGTWECSIVNTPDMLVRTELLQWMHEVHNNQWDPGSSSEGLLAGIGKTINDLSQGYKSIVSGVSDIKDDWKNLFTMGGQIRYQKDITIEQLDQEGIVQFTTTLIGAFPINVSTISLDDNNQEVSRTDVTFAYNDVRFDSKSSPIDIDDVTEVTNAFFR